MLSPSACLLPAVMWIGMGSSRGYGADMHMLM